MLFNLLNQVPSSVRGGDGGVKGLLCSTGGKGEIVGLLAVVFTGRETEVKGKSPTVTGKLRF